LELGASTNEQIAAMTTLKKFNSTLKLAFLLTFSSLIVADETLEASNGLSNVSTPDPEPHKQRTVLSFNPNDVKFYLYPSKR